MNNKNHLQVLPVLQPKNKKATEKVLSVYWFVILILVAGGVFAMVYNFYQHPYDVREIEANFLINHVADCIATGGIINEIVFEAEFTNNFMEVCRLTFEPEKDFEIEQYYLNVEVTGDRVVNIEEGNKNLISSCGFEKEIEEERIAKCVEREFFSLDSSGNVYSTKITSIVRKTEKNVR